MAMSVLVFNERLKLTAATLNTAATSSLTVGVLAPLAAAFYDVGGSRLLPVAPLVLGAALWISGVVALHIMARMVLGALRG
jgi:hypothetical protein